MHVRTSSRHFRTLGTGTIALSVGLGLLAGGLGTPHAASAAPQAPSVATVRTNVAVSRTVTVEAAAGATASTKVVTAAQPIGARVVTEAASHKGKLYLFGAVGPKRFDCSGFTLYVYKKTVGKKLPHKANLQQKYGKKVSKADARPGDLIIIRRGSYGIHAAIYAGNGMMWSAPRTGKPVSKQKIWSSNYVVRRLA
ncbi:glycoside hydrolase [Actinoplanes lobatus]|uniref:Cell wall-associated NlpC family hydrolase n=1 Tax=Actinoplanes lobatus TaxID=113568 RepID=A0A7W7HJP5_9ACTN|nr:C40 family peptidase [Actinoplanes lobatus]MBB4751750.1 cell wall-associated NlpC family hydrolase [Actinoplanes lobatus]GGN65582.1 glycoside hydrolase [Actinoplanes lobatus]GIE43332.1 glycoside hydrolase [Actinoplanes lobatus]